MSRWITDPDTGLYASLCTHMTTVIPSLIPAPGAVGKGEYGPNGVWVAQQLERVPFEKLTEPYGVILIPSFPRVEGWGAKNATYNPRVEMYLVSEQTWDGLEIAQYLEDLRDYMEAVATFNGNNFVEKVVELSWSDEIEANKILTNKGSTSRAGRIIVSLIVSETIPDTE